MFQTKPRVLKRMVACFTTLKQRWTHMAKNINNPDYDNGGLLLPAFFEGPRNDLTGQVVVFAVMDVASPTEAWTLVQNKLPVTGTRWVCTVAQNCDADFVHGIIAANYNDFESVMPIDAVIADMGGCDA